MKLTRFVEYAVGTDKERESERVTVKDIQKEREREEEKEGFIF